MVVFLGEHVSQGRTGKCPSFNQENRERCRYLRAVGWTSLKKCAKQGRRTTTPESSACVRGREQFPKGRSMPRAPIEQHDLPVPATVSHDAPITEGEKRLLIFDARQHNELFPRPPRRSKRIARSPAMWSIQHSAQARPQPMLEMSVLSGSRRRCTPGPRKEPRPRRQAAERSSPRLGTGGRSRTRAPSCRSCPRRARRG